MRIERRYLTAIIHLVSRIIRADRCISSYELKELAHIQQHFGFDRTLLAEAHQLSLAEAVNRLLEADKEIKKEVLQSLSTLAGADRVIDGSEAILLLSLRYCFQHKNCSIISGLDTDEPLDFSGGILYTQSDPEETTYTSEIRSNLELLQLLLCKEGFQFLYVEKMIEELASIEEEQLSLLLGYLAPQMTDAHIADFQTRMKEIDSATFCERVLVDTLHLNDCRNTPPCLLISLGGNDFLRIELQGSLVDQVRSFLSDYSEISSPSIPASFSSMEQGKFLYEGYGKLFFSLLVKSEPKKSSIQLWPNRSDFFFPEVGRTLKLNQQESSLYSLILLRTLTGDKKGLPLSYSADQKKIEALYRNIYCRKKLVETADALYPDNLAPIRARIEKKMREQLAGLENLEDYIPYNINREGFYRVTINAEMVKVRPDLHSEVVPLEDFRW